MRRIVDARNALASTALLLAKSTAKKLLRGWVFLLSSQSRCTYTVEVIQVLWPALLEVHAFDEVYLHCSSVSRACDWLPRSICAAVEARLSGARGEPQLFERDWQLIDAISE